MPSHLVPPRPLHEGVHPWTMICGPVRDDFTWCEARQARKEQWEDVAARANLLLDHVYRARISSRYPGAILAKAAWSLEGTLSRLRDLAKKKATA